MTQSNSPSLDKVLRGNLCAGCGACAAISSEAIKMQLAGDGFLRPVQTGDVRPEEEARIEAVCPGLGLKLELEAGVTNHSLWGPYFAMYGGYASDPLLRRNASSGGAISAILTHLLETGRVDSVLQVGADPDLPIANVSGLNETEAEIFASAGSRYSPSAPLSGLEDILSRSTRHAFVGKPCDVAALRALGRIDPRVAERFPFILSFFCAGVPSLAGAREILSKLEVEERSVANFRYRGDGWPGFATATLSDGSKRRMSYADSWGGILSRHVQFRCKICPDGIGSFADIVCADAWETDDRGYPLFAERDGISLVMSRTKVGEDILRSAEANARLVLHPFSVDSLAAMQPGQTSKRRLVLSRLAALWLIRRPIPNYRGFRLWENARDAGLLGTIRSFVGIFRRAIRGRL